MLMDTPVDGMNSSEPTKLIGMPSVTQNASRISRKSPRQNTTSRSPICAFLSSRFRRSS